MTIRRDTAYINLAHAPANREMFNNWWAQRFHQDLVNIASIHSIRDAKVQIMDGRVHRFDIQTGSIAARIKETNNITYHPRIEVSTIPNAIRRNITRDVNQRADILAQLTRNQLHPDIARIYEQHLGALFPRYHTHFTISCECNSPNLPCRHIAAIHIYASIHLDQNPKDLLELRGIDPATLYLTMNESTGRRRTMREIRYPYPNNPSLFWSTPPNTDPFPEYPEPEIPSDDAIILKQLGPFPQWEGQIELVDALTPIYQLATETAMNLAHDTLP